MNRTIIVFIFSCLTIIGYSQEKSALLSNFNYTINDFMAEINYLTESDDDIPISLKLNNIENCFGADYFIFNEKSQNSLKAWLFAYCTKIIQEQNINHEITLLEQTLRKLNNKDNRYSIDAILKRTWFANGLENSIEDTRINIIFVWRSIDNYSHITELNGDFSVSQIDKIALDKLREKLDGKYQYIYPFEQQLAVVSKDNKFGCIDLSGNEAIGLEYDNIFRFSETMAISTINGKFGYVSNHTIVPCVYDWAGEFKDGIAIVKQGDKYGCINRRGNTVIPIIYNKLERKDSVLLACAGEDKWGMYDITGKILLPDDYRSIEYLGKNGVLSKTKDKRFQLWDNNGKEIALKRNYDDAEIINGYIKVYVKNNNRTGDFIMDGQTYGLVDWNGNEILPPEYRNFRIPYGKETIVTEKYRRTYKGWEKSLALYNIELGKFVTDSNYWDIVRYAGMKDGVWIALNNKGKCGVINDKGAIIIPIKYDEYKVSYDRFNNKDILYYFHKGKYHYVDYDGNLLAIKDNRPYSEREAKKALYSQVEWLDYSLCAKVCINDKWGLVNTEIDVMVEPTFEDILLSASKDYLFVKQHGKWGVADFKGEIIIQPKFSAVKSIDGYSFMIEGNEWHLFNKDKNDKTVLVCDDIISSKDGFFTIKHLNGNIVTVDDKMNIIGKPREYMLNEIQEQ